MAKPKAAAQKASVPSPRKFHQIRIHDNRWLGWTIAICILACASLIGYIQVTDINFQTDAYNASSFNASAATFRHKTLNYSLKYPKSWGVEADGQASISFVNSSNSNEYFSVETFDASEESEVRKSLFVTNEKDIKVSGSNAVLISQEKSQAEKVALLKNSEMLYVLRGKGASFDRILSTFKIGQNIE